MNKLKSCIYKYAVPLAGRMLLSKNKFINVIYYHDVVKKDAYSYMKIQSDFFIKQMEFIKAQSYKTYIFSEIDNTSSLQFQPNSVLITFDDGWLSNYTEVFPLMKKLGIKFNIFLAAGLVGHDSRYMDWNMVREMAESGICGFGAHTFDHVEMSSADEIEVSRQITDANILIAENTGYVPKDFCFPKGIYTPEVLSLFLNETPYTRLYTSDLRYSYMRNDRIVFGRNAISNDESFKVFSSKIKGYYNIFSDLSGWIK